MDWSTPFDPSMLLSKDGVIVWCETDKDAEDFFDILSDVGAVTPGNRIITGRGDKLLEIATKTNGEDSCFRVSGIDHKQDINVVNYSSRSYYEREWSGTRYTFCKFLGAYEDEFSVATDDELKDLFS